jgi:hypothetical protein
MHLKNTQITTLLLVLSLIAIILGISACGQSPAPGNSPSTDNNPPGTIASGPLTVLSMTGGDVFIMEPGGIQWVKAEKGINLRVDHKIRTGSNSRATVTFFDGSTIDLEGDTEITLSELGFSPDSSITNIRVQQEIGETLNRVKKLVDPKSGYSVDTPAAVAAVRGTTFVVRVELDGKTFVGNIEGLVSVIAQGLEVNVTPGSHVMVVTGQPPGLVEPGANPPPRTTPAATASETAASPVPASPTPEATSKLSSGKIAIEPKTNRTTAFPGDTIAYTYYVRNSGAVPLSNISLTGNRGPGPVLTGGDSNSNNILDLDEIWVFNADYLVQAGESDPVTVTALVYGVDPDNLSVSASADITLNITPIIVKITGLEVGSVVGQTFYLSGTVNDPSINQAEVTVNNTISTLVEVKNGVYSTSVTLQDGENEITVSVTKPGGVAVSESVFLVPVTP